MGGEMVHCTIDVRVVVRHLGRDGLSWLLAQALWSQVFRRPRERKIERL